MKKGKIILLILLAGVLVGGAVGLYMWNKPHQQIEDVKGTEVSVTELSAAFSADETKANEQYLNKALLVKGIVTEKQQNQDGGMVIILSGDDPMATVQCTMRDKDVTADVGDMVKVKGMCTGSSLFGVLLSGCVMVK
ncbi:MAG: hypothetical protein H3C54_04915 [Taibaiella sp.]|nr:hypothetical protein [Taibaiella sp.]